MDSRKESKQARSLYPLFESRRVSAGGSGGTYMEHVEWQIEESDQKSLGLGESQSFESSDGRYVRCVSYRTFAHK